MATTIPYSKEVNSHLVYYEPYNEEHKLKEKERKVKKRKILKEVNCKEEKTSILDVVNNVDVSVLGLKTEQVKLVSLRVPFLSWLVHVRCAFPVKLGSVKNGKNWKAVHSEKRSRSRGDPKRNEALYFHRDYGLRGIGGESGDSNSGFIE